MTTWTAAGIPDQTGRRAIVTGANSGLSRSNFITRAWEDRGIIGQTMGRMFQAIATQPTEQGALPQLYAATAPEVRGGQFFGPDGRGERRGNVTRVHPSREAADPSLHKFERFIV